MDVIAVWHTHRSNSLHQTAAVIENSEQHFCKGPDGLSRWLGPVRKRELKIIMPRRPQSLPFRKCYASLGGIHRRFVDGPW